MQQLDAIIARFEKAEKKLFAMSLLRFKGLFKKHALKGGLQSFLSQFFRRNDEYNTIYVASGKQQSNLSGDTIGSSRSIIDIYRITRYYFPNVKLIDILAYLYKEAKDKCISTHVCSDVRRRVYEQGVGYGYDNITDTYLLDGCGMIWDDYTQILKHYKKI